jgi:hypothetical protein
VGVASWAGVVEICLAGTVLVWSTSASTRGGYGLTGSITAVALAGLLTLAGTVAVFVGLSALPKAMLAALLCAAVCGIVPLAVIDLLTESGGIGLLLVQPVIGMVVLAVHLIRTRRRSERDR